MTDRTYDAILAERLMQTKVARKLQGRYRLPEQYVSSMEVASTLVKAVGIREAIEILVSELERQGGTRSSRNQYVRNPLK